MIKKILVGVGYDPESDIALLYAGKLGYSLNAMVTAVHIVQEEQIPASWPIKKLIEEDIEDERQRVDKIFSELIKRKNLPHIHFKKVIKGDPADHLIKEAEKEGYDLIVIGHRNLANIKKLFLGSVSSKVVEYANISVLIAKQSSGPSKVLFCTDGSKCAEEAIRFGGEVIRELGCTAMVLNVTPWITDETERLAKDVAEEGAEILRGFGIDASAKAIFKKEITKEILNEADKGGFDLIVVGSRGLSGIHRFLLGSATLKLINQTRQSILIYKHYPRNK
ncbi:MAG: universal stress protein [Nitrospirota bacterium]